MILLTLFMYRYLKTPGRHMLSTWMQVTRHLQNPGVQEELLLVFLVLGVVVLTVLDRVPLETCVEVVACLLQLKSGEDGTDMLMSTRSGMLFAQPLLPLEFHL